MRKVLPGAFERVPPYPGEEGVVMDELQAEVSVVVRVDALVARHHGGLEGYRRSVPDAPYADDGVVTRVGFADAEAAGWWVRVLRIKGLRDDDIVVCSHTRPCS
jgi:hypothetical protein